MRLLSTSEAARRLQVCEGTVRNLDRRGIIKSFRDYQGRRRFNFADVQRLKEERSKLKIYNEEKNNENRSK